MNPHTLLFVWGAWCGLWWSLWSLIDRVYPIRASLAAVLAVSNGVCAVTFLYFAVSDGARAGLQLMADTYGLLFLAVPMAVWDAYQGWKRRNLAGVIDPGSRRDGVTSVTGSSRPPPGPGGGVASNELRSPGRGRIRW